MTNLMNTANEILSKPTAEEKKATIVNIPTDKLQAFEEHPFKVEVNEDMHALVESIQPFAELWRLSWRQKAK